MDDLTSPLVPRSLVDQLVVRLERAIMTGELADGTLIREQTLAQSLGVSLGPLREAIRRLEGRKLLQRAPNVGPRVLDLSAHDLREIWVVREALEGMACRLAALNITRQEIANLEAIVEAETRRVKPGSWNETYLDQSARHDLRHQLVVASRSERLIQMIGEDLSYMLNVYRYKWMTNRPKRAAQVAREHKTIVKALKKGDPDLAEQLMRAHIRASVVGVLDAPNG